MLYKTEYLGDGLYVEWDGYYVKLMANDQHNPTDTVYLEDNVLATFMKYIERLEKNDETDSDAL